MNESVLKVAILAAFALTVCCASAGADEVSGADFIACENLAGGENSIAVCTKILGQAAGHWDEGSLARVYGARGKLYLASGQYALGVADIAKAAAVFAKWPQASESKEYPPLLKAARVMAASKITAALAEKQCMDLDDTMSIAYCDAALRVGGFDDNALANIYNNRGIAFDSLDDHQEAIADYDRSLSLNPNSTQVLANRTDTVNRLTKAFQRNNKPVPAYLLVPPPTAGAQRPMQTAQSQIPTAPTQAPAQTRPAAQSAPQAAVPQQGAATLNGRAVASTTGPTVNFATMPPRPTDSPNTTYAVADQSAPGYRTPYPIPDMNKCLIKKDMTVGGAYEKTNWAVDVINGCSMTLNIQVCMHNDRDGRWDCGSASGGLNADVFRMIARDAVPSSGPQILATACSDESQKNSKAGGNCGGEANSGLSVFDGN